MAENFSLSLSKTHTPFISPPLKNLQCWNLSWIFLLPSKRTHHPKKKKSSPPFFKGFFCSPFHGFLLSFFPLFVFFFFLFHFLWIPPPHFKHSFKECFKHPCGCVGTQCPHYIFFIFFISSFFFVNFLYIFLFLLTFFLLFSFF